MPSIATDCPAMKSPIMIFMMVDWRDRLRAMLEAKGYSMRKASLEADLGGNYLHGVLVKGKDATVGSLMKIANALDEPIVSLFEEEDMAAARTRLQRIADRLSPDQLHMLESVASALAQGIPPTSPAEKPGKDGDGRT